MADDNVVRPVFGKRKPEAEPTERPPAPSEPTRDEFFYDKGTEKIYKGDEEIAGDELLQEVYAKHIKTTRPIHGLFLRTKLRFWRIWLA